MKKGDGMGRKLRAPKNQEIRARVRETNVHKNRSEQKFIDPERGPSNK